MSVAILLLGLAAVLVGYATSLGIGFELDDAYLIAANPWIQSLWHLPRYFIDGATLTPAIPANHDLRPILVTSYAINYAISGLNPWSYHVLGILIHLGAATMVFFLVRDRLWKAGGGLGAGLAAFCFAISPLNGQPIIYQSSRSASLMALGYLAAVYCYLRHWPGRGMLFQALALLTKAVALTLPGVLVLYMVVYRKQRDRRLWVALLLAGCLDAAYLMYRDLFGKVYLAHDAWVTREIWFRSQIPTWVDYARRFVWPSDLSIDHENLWVGGWMEPRLVAALLLVLAVCLAAVAVRARHPEIAFAVGWFFVTLVPEATVIPLAEVANDHRPYLPSVGLALLAAWILVRSLEAKYLIPACVLLALLSVGVNWQRNYIWRDTVRLWQDTAMRNPANGRAWMNAGVGLMARGHFGEARAYFDEALRRYPNYSFVYENLSILDRAEGKIESSAKNAAIATALGYPRGR